MFLKRLECWRCRRLLFKYVEELIPLSNTAVVQIRCPHCNAESTLPKATGT